MRVLNKYGVTKPVLIAIQEKASNQWFTALHDVADGLPEDEARVFLLDAKEQLSVEIGVYMLERQTKRVKRELREAGK